MIAVIWRARNVVDDQYAKRNLGEESTMKEVMIMTALAFSGIVFTGLLAFVTFKYVK